MVVHLTGGLLCQMIRIKRRHPGAKIPAERVWVCIGTNKHIDITYILTTPAHEPPSPDSHPK
jgi:hypothetical protein